MADSRHPPKFFITHSFKDKEFARRLADDLRAHGLDGFIDLYSLKPGKPIAKQISHGLEKCDVYVPVLSCDSLASPWCQEEIYAAIALSNERRRAGRPDIMPILVEDCEDKIPLFLRSRLYINFAGRYEEALQELLQQGFGVPPKPPPPSAPKPLPEAEKSSVQAQATPLQVVPPTSRRWVSPNISRPVTLLIAFLLLVVVGVFAFLLRSPSQEPSPVSPDIVQAFVVTRGTDSVETIQPGATITATVDQILHLKLAISPTEQKQVEGLSFIWLLCSRGKDPIAFRIGDPTMLYVVPRDLDSDCLTVNVEKGGALLQTERIFINIER